ncbi:MAG: hypothetical protein D6815_10495 [Candidatus Dadabacteria bacterium]|nr:MAG: hypothetical protein D6815_10495 [Candidatus Dadabacteria bacterium]
MSSKYGRADQTQLRALVVLLGLLVGWGLGAARPAAAGRGPRLVDAVAAAVDGEPITLWDLERFAQGRGRLLPPEERRDRKALLEALVRARMFAKEFDRYGIKAEDRDVEAYIDSRLAQAGSSREEVEAVLERMGLAWEDYFERMREEVQRLALINREIRAKVTVSPEEVRRYWQQSDEYRTAERVELAHIYIPLPADDAGRAAARAQAQAAYELARQGRFSEAARKYSKGPTAASGGNLGMFEVAALSAPFAKRIEGLREGQVTEPFEADGALHLLKVVKRLPPGRVPLEEVREEIREKLYDRLLQERYERWIREDLRRRHHVTMQVEEAPWASLARW